MDRRALTRLRIAFLLLGAALLVPLGLLLRSVDARMEAQRRLRHELVAERIFDEMEGELTALLSREAARPSDAYVGAGTRVENWAPFVVGYFTRDSRGAQIVAKPQLASERLQRLEAALKKLKEPGTRADSYGAGSLGSGNLTPAEALAAPVDDGAQSGSAWTKELQRPVAAESYEVMPAKSHGPEAKGVGAVAPSIVPAQQVDRAPEAVLKQLNRAADVREREQARPASKRKADSSKKVAKDDDDPLSGLE